MTGLRERKKRERRETVVSAARALFIEHGFENVTIEEIAVKADVSTGTVYNAFATKTDLLFEVFLNDMDEPIAATRKALGAEPSALAAIRKLIEIYFEWFDSYPKALVGLFSAAALSEPRYAGQDYEKLEQLIFLSIRDTFNQLAAQGRLQSGVKADQCARIIFNLANSEYYIWLMDEDVDAAEAVDQIMEQVQIVWRSMVRAPANAAKTR